MRLPQRLGHVLVVLEAVVEREVQDAVVLVAEVVDHHPLGGVDVRHLAVSTDTITTGSCTTWLWSMFSRSASGVVPLPAVRKTAVPGGRKTGGSMARTSSTKSLQPPFGLSRGWR